MCDNQIADVYNDRPKICSYLESAWRIESKTRQFPFVVAEELPVSENYDVEIDGPRRQFLVFHDIDHFIHWKAECPHVHEIIRCPTAGKIYKMTNEEMNNTEETVDNRIMRDDLSQGRLIFDFDLTKPLSTMTNADLNNPNTFVPANFTYLIESIVIESFRRYYQVDTSKLGFGWQYSPNPKKFSIHLVVKNAYFSEYWTQQMNGFYGIFKYVAAEMDLTYLLEAVDWQIARRNGTFRMVGSSKIGGDPLKLISFRENGQEKFDGNPDTIPFEDLLVGIYRHSLLVEEQRISMRMINYIDLDKTISSGNNPNLEKSVRKNLNLEHLTQKQANVDLNDVDMNSAIDLFDNFNDGSYKIKNNKGTIISLERVCPSECPISGNLHNHENPYLLMSRTGLLIFKCRRGCRSKNGYEGYVIGVYNQEYSNDPSRRMTKSTDALSTDNLEKVPRKQLTTSVIIPPIPKDILERRTPSPTEEIESMNYKSRGEAIQKCKTIVAKPVILPPKRKGKPSARLVVPAFNHNIHVPLKLRKPKNQMIVKCTRIIDDTVY